MHSSLSFSIITVIHITNRKLTLVKWNAVRSSTDLIWILSTVQLYCSFSCCCCRRKSQTLMPIDYLMPLGFSNLGEVIGFYLPFRSLKFGNLKSTRHLGSRTLRLGLSGVLVKFRLGIVLKECHHHGAFLRALSWERYDIDMFHYRC